MVDDKITDKNDEIQLLQDAVSNMNRGGPTHLVFKRLTGIILTQMSAKAGIRKYGNTAIDVLYDVFSVG